MKRPLKIYKDGEAPEPLIGFAVSRPVLLVTKSIRSRREWIDDPDAIVSGLATIRQTLSCVEGRPFAFFTSPAPELPSKVRTKKGLLWDYPKLRALEALHGEIEMSAQRTSLTSLTRLDEYEFADPNTLIMNWHRSVLVISDLDIETLFAITNRWVRPEHKGTIALDLERIFHDLGQLPSTAVLRYFGADNGRDEFVALVGHESLLDGKTLDCIDRLA